MNRDLQRARRRMDAIEAAPVPEPGETATGWRYWRMTADGHLIPPFASRGPYRTREPWQPGINTARCWTGHYAPADGCECGYRCMPHLYDLGIVLDIMRQFPREGRIDAIGQVELSGRILGASPNDPGGILRGRHAELIDLYVADDHADHADAIAARLGVPVTVGLPA